MYICHLSKKAMSHADLAALSDSEIFDLFAKTRWHRYPEEIPCPHCGVVHLPYRIQTRGFCCKHCKKQFSVTSGTLFARHKLSLRKLLTVIWEFSHAKHGISSYELAAKVGITQKSAFVLLHKLREALRAGRDETPINTAVHIDTCYVKVRTGEKKAGKYVMKKQCLLVVTSQVHNSTGSTSTYTCRKTGEKKEYYPFTKRTLVFPLESENRAEIEPIVRQFVAEECRISTDAARAYAFIRNVPEKGYVHRVVNHSDPVVKRNKMVAPDGTHVNWAEYYTARLKKQIAGTHYHCRQSLLLDYACEVAFRHDQGGNKQPYVMYQLLRQSLNATPSHRWRNYSKPKLAENML